MSFDSGRNSKNTKSNNKSSSSLSYGLKGTGSTMPAAGTSTENPVLIGTKSGTSDELLDTIQEDSEQKLRAEATTSDASPERVAEDVIKKINKGETSYNFIPSSFEVFLLQNSKNKVLFNFTRPVFSYNLNIVSPVEQSNIPKRVGDTGTASPVDLEENITPAIPKQIDISNFSILFYKTKNKPASLEEIKVETNLYKTLIPAKKELSVIDFLDVNVDYYFYASPEQGLVDKIKDLIVTEFDLSINDFKITSAEEKGILTDYIYRVKIIKDGELYFLEKEVFDPNKKEDKKKTKNFFGTILAEPKYEFVDTTINNFSKTNSNLPFVPGDAVFDSGENYPYIKLRFKSKKSNRKFDVNLRYTVANTPPVELSENNIGQEKYTKLKKFIPKVPTMKLTDIKYSDFFASKDSRLSAKKFVTEIESLTAEITNGQIKVSSEIQKTDDQAVDIIFKKATNQEINLIKSKLNFESPLYKLINKAKPQNSGNIDIIPYIYLDLGSYLNYSNNRPSKIYSDAIYKKFSDGSVLLHTFKDELYDLFLAIKQVYPKATIDWNPNYKFDYYTETEEDKTITLASGEVVKVKGSPPDKNLYYQDFKIYDLSLDELQKLPNLQPLKDIEYVYIDEDNNQNTVPPLVNFKQLTEGFKKYLPLPPDSNFIIDKAAFGNFLSNPESREPNLLQNFIKELNNYYSNTSTKSIIYEYVNDKQILYKFFDYTREEIDKFLGDYPTDSYLKEIYTSLSRNIDTDKETFGDTILQL